MTEKKLNEALQLQDDILRFTKYVEDLDELFREWQELHKKSDTYDFVFVDHKKEWNIITKMALEFDNIREEVVRETLHFARMRRRELNERVVELNRKFAKL